MSKFVDPPLLSPNTVAAAVVRTARMLGIALPTICRIIGHASSDARKAKVFAGYEPDERDVFVATFPKSGTNWAMQMAASSDMAVSVPAPGRRQRSSRPFLRPSDTHAVIRPASHDERRSRQARAPSRPGATGALARRGRH